MKIATQEATTLDAIESVDGTALALVDNSDSLSYGQMRGAARQIASRVQERYGTEQYILVRATSDVWFVTSLLGILYSGNTPIPVDEQAPLSSLSYMKDKAGAVDVIAPLRPGEFEALPPTFEPNDSRPALILFTSGTTGFPKGVIISHQNLSHSCRAISSYLGYPEHPSAAVVLPLHYSYALLSQVWCQLSIGGLVRLFSNFKNPIKFSRVANEMGLETFCGVPATYNALATIHHMSPIEMPGFRVLCSAGAAMDRSKFGDIKKIFPNAVFFNNYGMTEAAPRISYIREDDPRFFEPTCGHPMDGVQVKIVDPETHVDLPDGEPGMLVVRGPNITPGYLNDEKITQESFTADGHLISGDVAYSENGYFFICGRHDDIFNVGGEKVAPLEIERALHKNSAIEAAAVSGLADEARGKIPVAFLKLKQAASRRDIMGALDGELPPVKIPQRYFEVSGFPVTSNGKIQRRKLSVDDSFVIREIV